MVQAKGVLRYLATMLMVDCVLLNSLRTCATQVLRPCRNFLNTVVYPCPLPSKCKCSKCLIVNAEKMLKNIPFLMLKNKSIYAYDRLNMINFRHCLLNIITGNIQISGLTNLFCKEILSHSSQVYSLLTHL